MINSCFIFKEREKVRQHLREKYNLEKPESVEEPEEETESSSSGFKKLKGFKKNHFHDNIIFRGRRRGRGRVH